MSDCRAPKQATTPEVDKKYIIWPHGEPEQIRSKILNHKGEPRGLPATTGSGIFGLSPTTFPILSSPRLRDYAGKLLPRSGNLPLEQGNVIITLEQDRRDQMMKKPVEEDFDPWEEAEWMPDFGCQSCKGKGKTLIVSNQDKHMTCTVCLGHLIPPIPPTEIYKHD